MYCWGHRRSRGYSSMRFQDHSLMLQEEFELRRRPWCMAMWEFNTAMSEFKICPWLRCAICDFWTMKTFISTLVKYGICRLRYRIVRKVAPVSYFLILHTEYSLKLLVQKVRDITEPRRWHRTPTYIDFWLHDLPASVKARGDESEIQMRSAYGDWVAAPPPTA